MLLFIVLFCFHELQSDEVADTIRSFAQLEGRQPTVAILDPVDQRVYALPDDLSEITRSDIESLIDKFKESVVLSNCLGSIPAGS